MTNSRLSWLLPVRLWAAGGQLLCRFPLPQERGLGEGIVRELVLVAGPTPPYFRRLMVYQGATGHGTGSDSPRAA